MSTELVERLREASKDGWFLGCVKDGKAYCSILEAADELTALTAKVALLTEALRGLIDQLDAVHADPRYARVWAVAQLHSAPYAGPTYIDELAAARRALSEPDKDAP